jgi:sec-independent protein translocase protein TatC
MSRTPRDPEGRMPLREHLVEVRKRVVRIALGLLVGAILGWIVYDPLLDALVEPLARASEERGALIGLNFDGVATAIDIHFKVALFLGVIVSSPWWLYQVFAFVNPGLTRDERKYVFGFLAAAVPMFLGGVVMAWLVLPSVVLVLNSFVPEGNANLIGAQLYLGFVMRLVLACGIAFLVPVFMVVLNLMGVVSARTWLAGWRWAILVSFVFAAMVTPTLDVMTMFGLATPICVLYFAATGICFLHDRRAARRRVVPAG